MLNIDMEIGNLTKTLESMQRFAQHAEDFIIILDRTCRIRYVNDYAVRLLDSRAQDLLGKPLCDVFPTRYKEVQDRLRTTFSTGDPFSFEKKISCNGDTCWLDVRCSPIRDDHGAVIAVLCLSRDITERKEREQLIVRSKDDWLRAVDNLPSVLAVVDRDYRIQRVNTNMADRLGISTRQAAGMICFKKLHGVNKPLSFCPLMKSMADDKDHTVEIHENHLGCESVSLSSFRDKEGKIAGCIFVGRPASAAIGNVRTEQCIKSLMRKVDYIIRVQDKEGRYLFLTAIVAGNLQHADVIGKTPVDFFEPTVASRMVERLRKAVASRKGFTEAGEVTWKGETFHFLDQISPIKNADGNVDVVVTVSKKVAETRRASDSLAVLSDGAKNLSPREREILQLIAHGLSIKEIAEKLCISAKTVETHRARIMQKLDLHKTSGLVSFAVSSGLF